MKRILVLLLLSMAVSACDSSATDNTSNNNTKPAQTATIPAASPATTPDSTTSRFKAGEKVKVKIDGKPAEATVVSVDDKANQAKVKLASGAEKTVPISDVSKP